MAWHDRMKVAVGTARGLRYLHEDFPAGCIVHGDLRPTNIHLTHDFEPTVCIDRVYSFFVSILIEFGKISINVQQL